MNIIENFLYTETLDLNLEVQRKTAHYMHSYIDRTFQHTPTAIDGAQRNPLDVTFTGQVTLSTKLFDRYNYLMYPLPGIHNLYRSIQKVFREVNTDSYDDYFIQCWLNFYYKGDFIDWHGHWETKADSWHGFYCLDVEPNSYTQYKFLHDEKVITVPSQDNLIVISRSGNDQHKSSEWTEDRPRITIAFDIVPAQKLFEVGAYRNPNHWIPI
jgi:hypothetical protein